MLGVGIIVPILPLYAETLGATGLWLGAIFAAFSLTRSIAMPLIGRFSDRLGRKRFITSGLLIYTLSSLGYIYASSTVELIVIRVIQGFSSAMIIPIAMAFIADISPPDKEGSYMGIFTIALFLGFGCGPILGGLTEGSYQYGSRFPHHGGTLSPRPFFGADLPSPIQQHPEKPTPVRYPFHNYSSEQKYYGYLLLPFFQRLLQRQYHDLSSPLCIQ